MTIFKADGSQFDAGQKLTQIGSIVDGTFVLNAKDYEYEDLKDIRKETTIGFNVTIYPNTVYNARDNAGAVIFDQGQRIKQVGTTISSGIQFGYVNENRDIKATIGNGVTTNFDTQGVNRDIEKAVGDWQGINIETFSMDLGTEYWLTQAGRGALLDQIDDAKRGYKGLKDILSSEGKFSDLVKGEKFVRRLEELGIFDIKGKTEEDIAAEIRARASHLLDSDLEVDVKFYGKDDIKEITDMLTVQKLLADGFVVALDGSIWVNTSILENNTLNFNMLLAHELGHLMGGNETIANYMEKSYGEFVGGVGSNGYVDIGGSIRDWGKNPLSGEDANRLLGYKADEIEFKGYALTEAQIKTLVAYAENSTELEKGVFTKKELNVLRNKKIAGITDGNLKVWKDGKIHVIELGTKNADGTTNVNFYVAGLSEKQSDNYTDAIIKVIENDAAKIVVLVTTEFDTWMNYNPDDEIYPGAYFSSRTNDTIITGSNVTEIEKALLKSDGLKLNIGEDVVIGVGTMTLGPLLSKGGKGVKLVLTGLGTVSAGFNGKASYDSYQNGDKDYAIYYGIKSGISIGAAASILSSSFQGSNGKEIGNIKGTATKSQLDALEFALKADPKTIYVNSDGVATKGSDLNAAGQTILNYLVNNSNTTWTSGNKSTGTLGTSSGNQLQIGNSSNTNSSIIDFYGTAKGDIVPAIGYRYVSMNAPYLNDLKQSMVIPENPNGTYISFDKYDYPSPDKLQVPHDASIRLEFNTHQILNDLRVPQGKYNTANYLEPITTDYPEYGKGGATQMITNMKIFVDKIIELNKK